MHRNEAVHRSLSEEMADDESAEQGRQRMLRLAGRLRRHYQEDPEYWWERLERVETSLRVIRARVHEFRSWNETPQAAEACDLMDDGLVLAGCLRDSDAPWLAWIAASAFAGHARKVLLARYSREIVDALFEPDFPAVSDGRRALTPCRPDEEAVH